MAIFNPSQSVGVVNCNSTFSFSNSLILHANFVPYQVTIDPATGLQVLNTTPADGTALEGANIYAPIPACGETS